VKTAIPTDWKTQPLWVTSLQDQENQLSWLA
jgi:hypothetical protein